MDQSITIATEMYRHGGIFQFKYFHISIRPTYPCRSSGIESSINAVFNRLNPPVLKLMPPLVPVLKGWLLVFDNPCKSKVPNGFFERALFTSLRFSVKFWRKSPPPVDRMMMEIFVMKILVLYWRGAVEALCGLKNFFHLLNWMKIARESTSQNRVFFSLWRYLRSLSLSWCFFQFHI